MTTMALNKTLIPLALAVTICMHWETIRAQPSTSVSKDRFGNILTLEVNPETGSVARVDGLHTSIESYGLHVKDLNRALVSKLAASVFDDYASILGLQRDQIKTCRVETDGAFWYIYAAQTIDGIPVYGTQVGFSIDPNGNIIALGSEAFPKATLSTSSFVTPASNAMATAFALAGLNAVQRGPDSSVVLPTKAESGQWSYHLCWRFQPVNTVLSQELTKLSSTRMTEIQLRIDNISEYNIHGHATGLYCLLTTMIAHQMIPIRLTGLSCKTILANCSAKRILMQLDITRFHGTVHI